MSSEFRRLASPWNRARRSAGLREPLIQLGSALGHQIVPRALGVSRFMGRRSGQRGFFKNDGFVDSVSAGRWRPARMRYHLSCPMPPAHTHCVRGATGEGNVAGHSVKGRTRKSSVQQETANISRTAAIDHHHHGPIWDNC